MGIDATNKWPGETAREWGRPIAMDAAVSARVDAGEAVVHAYSHYDPLVVPGTLVDVLRRFDGRRTEVVLAELEGEGVSLDASALRQLVDFEVLVAAP